MKPLSCLLIVVCFAFTGCRGIRPNYSLFDNDREEHTDELWRQGYGFNNPNVERIKNGERPVDFNGSPHNSGSAIEKVAGRAVGNALGYAIFEGIPSIFRGLTARLRQ